MILFTHLKIILLQCFQFSVFSFQFSVFSNNKLNPNGPYIYIYIYIYINRQISEKIQLDFNWILKELHEHTQIYKELKASHIAVLN